MFPPVSYRLFALPASPAAAYLLLPPVSSVRPSSRCHHPSVPGSFLDSFQHLQNSGPPYQGYPSRYNTLNVSVLSAKPETRLTRVPFSHLPYRRFPYIPGSTAWGQRQNDPQSKPLLQGIKQMRARTPPAYW